MKHTSESCPVSPGPVRADAGCGFTGTLLFQRPCSCLFADHAYGSHIVDVDGNTYLDYIGSWGPMILGHAHPL